MLFSAVSQIQNQIIHPKKVDITCRYSSSFCHGKITMQFKNSQISIDKFKILIGKNSGNSICLHGFQIKIDNNLIIPKMIKNIQSKNAFENKIKRNGKEVFGIGDDSYSSFIIKDILKNQIVTISVNFELPAKFISEHSIGLFFPITCPGLTNDEILNCTDFHFSMGFQSNQRNGISISSNPEGNFDFNSSTYSIDHLDSTLTYISVTINSTLSNQLYQTNDSIVDPSFFANRTIVTCCGNYGSITYIPNMEIEANQLIKEFIFMIDCSSRNNEKEMKLAADCLTLFIKSLPAKCNFNVVRYGSNVASLFESPVPYNDSNVNKALNLAKSLKANLGNANLTNALFNVFSKSFTCFSQKRKLFVLTSDLGLNSNEAISLVQRNSNSTTCNVIGIGYRVDQDSIRSLANAGKGLCDFVLSGDDVRSKVVNQLRENLNGLCRIIIYVENNDDVEFSTPLSNCRFSPGKSTTVYFKTSSNLNGNLRIKIDDDRNPNTPIINMKEIPLYLCAPNSLEYLFNYDRIKYLRGLKQTAEIASKISELSIQYEILSPYTKLTCEQDRASAGSLFQPIGTNICVKMLSGKSANLLVNKSEKIEDNLRLLIHKEFQIPPEYQRIIFSGKELLDGTTIDDYSIQQGSTIYLVSGLRKILPQNSLFEYAQRNFVHGKTDDVISVISEQMSNDCWKEIPEYLKKWNCEEMKRIIQKVQHWVANNIIYGTKANIIGTVVSLIFLEKYKKECFEFWSLIYLKSLRWLYSINPEIDWREVIQAFSSNVKEVDLVLEKNRNLQKAYFPENLVLDDDFLE